MCVVSMVILRFSTVNMLHISPLMKREVHWEKMVEAKKQHWQQRMKGWNKKRKKIFELYNVLSPSAISFSLLFLLPPCLMLWSFISH